MLIKLTQEVNNNKDFVVKAKLLTTNKITAEVFNKIDLTDWINIDNISNMVNQRFEITCENKESKSDKR